MYHACTRRKGAARSGGVFMLVAHGSPPILVILAKYFKRPTLDRSLATSQRIRSKEPRHSTG